MIPPSEGFWGPPTSTVDWCEANYERTRYVCELYNTLSSAALLGAGVLGASLHWKTLERRFIVAFAALAVVGIGSIAFHATLRFELQMLDELPMLYTALVMIFIVTEDRPQRRFGALFPALLVVHGVAVTCLSAFTRGAVQFYAFQTSFATMEGYALYATYRVYRRSRDAVPRRLYRAGMASYAIAVALWFIDIRACGVLQGYLPQHGIPNPQFHAWWHVLVSIGFYLLVLTLAWERLRVLGSPRALRFAAGAIPYIERGAQRA